MPHFGGLLFLERVTFLMLCHLSEPDFVTPEFPAQRN